MSARYKRLCGIFVYIFLIFPFSAINAAGIASNNLIEYSLNVTQQNTDFQYTANTNKITTEQIGINWYEAYSSYFNAGLELGYINATQKDNGLISAQYTSGEYVGLLLRFLPIENDVFSLTVNLNYRYNQTKGQSTSQETQLTWRKIILSNELQYKLLKNIGLFVTADYLSLKGSQRDYGNINQLSHFNNPEKQGYSIGINYQLDRTGIIRIEWLTGFRTGSQIYFTRTF